MKTFACLVTLLIATTQVRSDDSYARAQEQLRKTVFSEYNAHALPNQKTLVNVTGIVITDIAMNEAEHVMELRSWFKYDWNDPRLTWEPTENQDIQYLAVDSEKVWRPDFTIYNSASSIDTVRTHDVYPLVFPNGKVLFVPPCDFRFQCIMDLTYWPHDVHNCSVKIGSWVHSAEVMDIVLDAFEVEVLKTEELSASAANPNNLTTSAFDVKGWTVERLVKYYDCCSVPYVSMITSLLVQRNGQAYNWTVKLPVVCLCLMTLALFLMPPAAGEKIVFGAVCLGLDLLFLHYVTDQIGQAPTHTPLIVQLLGQQIVLVLASVLLSAIVVRTATGPHSKGLPSFLKGPTSGLAKFLFLGNYVTSDGSLTEEVENGTAKAPLPSITETASSNASEWLMLSAIVDRVALFAYLIICVISLIRFTVVL